MDFDLLVITCSLIRISVFPFYTPVEGGDASLKRGNWLGIRSIQVYFEGDWPESQVEVARLRLRCRWGRLRRAFRGRAAVGRAERISSGGIRVKITAAHANLTYKVLLLITIYTLGRSPWLSAEAEAR